MSELSEIVRWTTVLLQVGAFLLTLFVRRVMEAFFPALAKQTPITTSQNVWERVVLPFLPIGFGMLLVAVLPYDTYPSILKSLGWRLLFGAVGVGLPSEWGYRFFKQLLKGNFKVEAPESLP